MNTQPDPFIERLRVLSANRCHTHLEIATVVGVTGERIRQIEAKALRKCWRALRHEREAIRL